MAQMMIRTPGSLTARPARTPVQQRVTVRSVVVRSSTDRNAEHAKDAGSKVVKGLEDLASTAVDATADAYNATKKTIERGANALTDSGKDAGDKASDNLKGAKKDAGNALEDAKDWASEKAHQASKAVDPKR